MTDTQSPSEPRDEAKRRRPAMFVVGVVTVSAVILAGVAALFVWSPAVSAALKFGAPALPRPLLNEDFQRPKDVQLALTLKAADPLALTTWLDREILKPVVDDINTLALSLEAVEVTQDQLPDHPEMYRAIVDCARILGIPQPRVYVVSTSSRKFVTTNVENPIILVPASALSRYTSAAEWRFLIGREMGHIRCDHVRWLMVTRALHETLNKNDQGILIAPLLAWAREAEMTADNAGLICAQDLKVAEATLVKQMLNVNASAIGEVNVDSLLRQRESVGDVSPMAEGVQYVRTLSREDPLTADRIQQLRTYAASASYKSLWER